MDWPQLLSQDRLGRDSYNEDPNRPVYVQDFDRIAFCAPFRRLANKTQVHPLYDNDHLHHRLIHSVETASIGRSLGVSVGHWLEQKEELVEGQKHRVSGIVQAACLAHDIGNPPFGHSGEAAIGAWFGERFEEGSGLFSEVDASKAQEFRKFEGNAQGFRLLARLEMYRNAGGMQLSEGVLGAFLKYPVTASVSAHEGQRESPYCGVTKFGVFESELEILERLAEKMGLPLEASPSGNWWRRHPLVFLVEAADDICYNILDIEDAYDAGDLPFEEVEKVLLPLINKNVPLREWQVERERVDELRARSIGASIDACVEAFAENYSDIMRGDFPASLLSMSSCSDQFEEIKNTARSRIFRARRKTDLEIVGRNAIHRVLDGILPVFEVLREKNWQSERIDDYSGQVVRALRLDLRDVRDSYSALHAMTDFVSGMTDRYSLRVAEMLSGRTGFRV